MSKLRIAIQKSGRLSEKSLELLQKCGIKISNGDRKLIAESNNFPIEILYLRDDDIPQYVEQNVADIGILGLNEVIEKTKKVNVIEELGFATCRLSLAIPKENNYDSINYFNGKKVATSYPKILKEYFNKKGVIADIEEISGSVEIAPGIGLADAIFDIVSTGSTLITNGLREVETVMKSQAVIIATPNLSEEKEAILSKLIFRIKAVINSRENKYILLNAPISALEEIKSILPGMKSPTIIPLAIDGWVSLHSVIKEDEFWGIIYQLKNVGAEGILVIPIEKMIL